ncbi:MAG TPA: TonB-dependent receptor [Sphingomicrobium sp.]|nr:TonB-dependent receptor [Sphingomicrobium sp.]
MRLPYILLLSTAAIGIASPSLAQTGQESAAQSATPPEATQGDEIIVTATKRASRVQDVPFSINAQTEEDIQRANASTIEDISRNVAGLTVQNLGPGQSQVSVRGVSAGQIARDQPGVKEQVGVYLDESVISLSLFTPDVDLFDLNRVETLRGPQGTLFGSGSVGGTLRYITNQPLLGQTEGLLEGNINVLAGNDVGYHTKGVLNVPLGESMALRAVGYGTHYAGFIDAKGPAGGENVNDGYRVGGRVSVLIEPTPDLKITPRVLHQKIKANGFNREEEFNLFANRFTAPPLILEDREQYLLLREQFKDKVTIADLVASYDFGGVEVTSVTSHTDRALVVSRDASALTGSISLDFGFGETAAEIPSNLVDTTDLDQWTQEVRFSSTTDGPLQWVAGAFYSNAKRDYTQTLPTPGYDVYVNAFLASQCAPDDGNPANGDEDAGCKVAATLTPFTTVDIANGFALNSPYNAAYGLKSKQTALFGEATYDFGQFKLTAGGRYYDFKETRVFRNGGVFAPGVNQTDKVKSNGFSPRVIATYEPNRNLSFNVQAAKGFRLGGVNDPLNTPLCDNGVPNGPDFQLFGQYQTFDDETLWNYEAGVKYSKGPITFNAAAFYNDIKNLQVTLTAGTCSSRISFNVPKAHSQGIEAEFTIRAANGLDISVTGSFVDAKFDTTVTTGDGTQIPGLREGNRLPTVPKFQMAAAVNYEAPLTATADLLLGASYQHISSRYTQPDDQEDNPRRFNHPYVINGMNGTGFTVLDLQLPAYDLVNLSAGVAFSRGLSVTAYVNNLFDKNARLSFDRERGGQARLGFTVGQPRTVGLTVRQKFGR